MSSPDPWALAAEVARMECIESAEEMGMHMSCADEGECPEPLACPFQQHVPDRMRKALEELGSPITNDRKDR